MHNIILVGFVNEDLKKIGLKLSNKLNFFYLNCEEMIKYSLMDTQKMKKICGMNYLAKQENKIVKSLSDYERTIITMNYQTFKDNMDAISTNKITIYMRLTQIQLKKRIESMIKEENCDDFVTGELEIANLVFEERDKFLKKNCDFEIKYGIPSIDQVIEAIIEKVKI